MRADHLEITAFFEATQSRRKIDVEDPADLKQLEEGARRLQGGSPETGPAGQQVRAFRGTGNRVYLTGIALTVNATVEGIDEETFQTIAGGAKEGCPVSQALKAVDITLDATLA